MTTAKLARHKSHVPTEAIEQRRLAAWLRAKKLTWMHTPNEGKRSRVTGAHLKALGMAPGFPDILIFNTPPRQCHVWAKGVAIELKSTRKGAKATPAQIDWLDKLEACGWAAVVCYGADDAIQRLTEMGF